MTRKLIGSTFLSVASALTVLLAGSGTAAAFHEANHPPGGGRMVSEHRRERALQARRRSRHRQRDRPRGPGRRHRRVSDAPHRETAHDPGGGIRVQRGRGKQIDTSFTFDGKTYPVGTGVNSEADIVFGGAEYGFDVVHNDVFALGLTLGVRAVSAKASIEAPLLDQKGEGSSRWPCPPSGSWGSSIRSPSPSSAPSRCPRVLVGGTIGDRGSFIDVDGGVEWLPIPVLAIRVGYRYFHAEGEEDDGDEAEVDLSGPYASATLSF